MSRQDRCDEYAAKPKGPHGAGRDQANTDAWSKRATQNSQLAPRATRKADMPTSGKKMDLRDTDMGPRVPRGVNARMRAT